MMQNTFFSVLHALPTEIVDGYLHFKNGGEEIFWIPSFVSNPL